MRYIQYVIPTIYDTYNIRYIQYTIHTYEIHTLYDTYNMRYIQYVVHTICDTYNM